MHRPLLRIGSRGPAVLELQQALNVRKESRLPALAEDSVFGSKTRRKVVEFQTSKGLVADAIVGAKTYKELEPLIELLKHLVELIVPPETVTLARQRIADLACLYQAQHGWRRADALYNPQSQRIAGRYPSVKFEPPGSTGTTAAQQVAPRQGGGLLAILFGVAGANPARCPTITKSAFETYNNGQATPYWRNNNDLPNWCGIFALYVYKTAGLRMRPWKQGHTLAARSDVITKSTTDAEFIYLRDQSEIAPGDLGLVHPSDYNHHFLVVKNQDGTLSAVDGNAGDYQSIVSRRYTITGSGGNFTVSSVADDVTTGSKHPGMPVVFFRPNWNKVLGTS